MSECFTDRELSWLQFNLRVLKEADDKSVPLLERLKFLSIYNSNMDEFFMVRIGSLMHREVIMPSYRDPKTGWDTTTVLKQVSSEVSAQQEIAAKVYKRLAADLKEKNIEIMDFRHLSKMEESVAKKVFSEIKPLLSPGVVDAEHSMPFTWNLSTNVSCLLEKGGKMKFGLVSLDRIPSYRVFEAGDKQKVIIVSQLICHYAKHLFKEYNLKESCSFRVTRNADVFIDDMEKLEDGSIKKSMEKLLRKRKRELPVRLQIEGRISGTFLQMIEEKLGIANKYAYMSAVPFCLDFSKGLKNTAGLKYEDRPPVRNVKLKKGQYFKYLEQHDLLLSFPFQSIAPFIDLLYEAADDPEVHSIKITLYRLASSSKIAVALAYAAEKGKEVECLLELRARFDEQNNIDYSEMLESAGCKVYYGLPNYKVHSKICLITRKVGDEIRYITQVGTGNYNENTSEQYCDLSLITSDFSVGEDASKVFTALSQGTIPVKMKSLYVAPYSYKAPVMELLERERHKGKDGFVQIKVNSINDVEVMDKLIECSRAGVSVDLFVRGICCIIPGIQGSTENIRVSSIVGRYLEHSRIFVFGKGEDRVVLMGSGDLLNRNTERRIEVFIEVKDEHCRADVLQVMKALENDGEKRWNLKPDRRYEKVPYVARSASQDLLYDYFSRRTVELIEKPEGLFTRISSWLKKVFQSKSVSA